MNVCVTEAKRTVWREQEEETEKSKQLKATLKLWYFITYLTASLEHNMTVKGL